MNIKSDSNMSMELFVLLIVSLNRNNRKTQGEIPLCNGQNVTVLFLSFFNKGS